MSFFRLFLDLQSLLFFFSYHSLVARLENLLWNFFTSKRCRQVLFWFDNHFLKFSFSNWFRSNLISDIKSEWLRYSDPISSFLLSTLFVWSIYICSIQSCWHGFCCNWLNILINRVRWVRFLFRQYWINIIFLLTFIILIERYHKFKLSAPLLLLNTSLFFL